MVKVLITIGGTREKIDPVRFISNESSGEMGYQIAREFWSLDYEVISILGINRLNDEKLNLLHEKSIKVLNIETAIDIEKSVFYIIENYKPEIYISVAAISDFRSKNPSNSKIKKDSSEIFTIDLIKNPDILSAVSNMENNRPKLVVGFAAEDGNKLEENAMQKLEKKKLDIIVANPTNYIGDIKNQVLILNRYGEKVFVGENNKSEIAKIIVQYIDSFYKLMVNFK